MGGTGDCLDNSIVESFFKSLKAELGWPRNRQTKRKVKVARFDYLKSFYNPWRKHSGSGGKSPWLTYKAPPVISTDWNDPGQAQSHAPSKSSSAALLLLKRIFAGFAVAETAVWSARFVELANANFRLDHKAF